MSEQILICGYALAFGKSVLLAENGEYERFDRHAFDAQLARHHSIDIRWESHDDHAPRIADSRDHTAGMFVDNFGLAFWAKVESREHWNKLRMITTARNPIDQCSVGGLRIDASRKDLFLGARRTTVTAARIDHICITSKAAYGAATGVWLPDHDLSQAPWRVQQMSRHWGIGRRDIVAAERMEIRRSNRHGSAPTSAVLNRYPAKLRATLAPYSARLRVARERIVMNLIASGAKSLPVMAHGAFADPNWDRNWDALYSAARARMERGQ